MSITRCDPVTSAPTVPMHPALPALALAPAGIALRLLRLPFDVIRAQHARAVNVGLAPRSLLASRDFEHAVVLLEQLTLGALARRI